MRSRHLHRLIHRSLAKYKHVVDVTTLATDFSGGVQTTDIILSTDNPVIGNTTNVMARARVMLLTSIEISFYTTKVIPADQIYDSYILFNPQATLTPVSPRGVGSSNLKSYVIWQGHVVHVGGNPASKWTGKIRIPRKYQRFMNADKLQFVFISTRANGATDNFIFKCIYKEVRG